MYMLDHLPAKKVKLEDAVSGLKSSCSSQSALSAASSAAIRKLDPGEVGKTNSIRDQICFEAAKHGFQVFSNQTAMHVYSSWPLLLL